MWYEVWSEIWSRPRLNDLLLNIYISSYTKNFHDNLDDRLDLHLENINAEIITAMNQEGRRLGECLLESLRFTFYILQTTFYILLFTSHILHPTYYILCFTFYILVLPVAWMIHVQLSDSGIFAFLLPVPCCQSTRESTGNSMFHIWHTTSYILLVASLWCSLFCKLFLMSLIHTLCWLYHR